MLNFPDRYFEPEVRDGFYVPGKMKRFWASQLEVLAEIDRICKKHRITYFAEWGTLLGAVRHHGFIPWDDDLDIAMKRADYDKFLSVAPKELTGSYFIMNYETCDDYWDVMSRVVNSQYASFDEKNLETFHDSPYICGVDIFPLDYFPRDPKQQELQKNLVQLVFAISELYECDESQRADLPMMLEQLEICTGHRLNRLKPIRPQLYKLLISIYSMYGDNDSDNLAIVHLYAENGNKGYHKSYYKNVIYMPFENIEIPVPIGYQSILTQKYGNYMQLVKNGGGSTHDYPLYKKQEEELKEGLGLQLPHFTYTHDLLNIPRESGFRQCIKSNAQTMIGLFQEATANIENALFTSAPATALDLLNQCQNGAIQLGNMIESATNSEHPVIKEIENYCELIYQVYQAITEQAEFNPSDVCALLLEQLSVLADTIENQLIIKRIVVFLPFRDDTWPALEGLWKKETDIPNTEVYVLPIPYFYKDYFGNFRKPVFYGDRLPEYVHPMNYELFDFAKIHPDTIYTQYPYDDYNAVTNILPTFYAQNLIKCTDELIYVPYFTTDEIDWENPHETDLMEDYVTMPGVVLADKVIVQSETMRESYIRKLTEWAGEDTREIWEAKIVGTGHPLMELKEKDMRETIDIPENWKALLLLPFSVSYTQASDSTNESMSNSGDNHRKKVLLYSVGISSLLEYQDKMIDKIQRSLNTMKNQQDKLATIFRPQNMLDENLKRLNPQLWRKYNRLVQNYIEENWGIYDDTPDENTAITLCDGYYGDADEIAQKTAMLKKAVMIHKVDC